MLATKALNALRSFAIAEAHAGLIPGLRATASRRASTITSLVSSSPPNSLVPATPPISLRVLTAPADPATNEHLVLITATPPEDSAIDRLPVDVSVVVDTSGSMATAATIKTGDDSDGAYGLNLLDTVKHAVRTISETLDSNDRLSLTSFSSNADLKSRLKFTTADNKADLQRVTKGMMPGGATNLWDGLKAGMDELRDGSFGQRSKQGRFVAHRRPAKHRAAERA